MVRTILCCLVLSASLAAQVTPPPHPVAFTGVVEHVSSPSTAPPCVQPSFRLACSDGTFFLQSSHVDLGLLVGHNVKLVALLTDPGCKLYEVTGVIDPPPAVLSMCGTPALGCPIRFRSAPGGLSQHVIWAALAPGLLPLNVSKGSFLLGSPFVEIGAAAGGFGPAGAAFDFQLPGDPNLVGIPLWVQNARRDVGPVGPFALGNAVCFTILPGTLPCQTPDC